MSHQIDVEKVLLQDLVENSPDYIFIKDRQSRFVFTNKAHSKTLLGLENPEDAFGKTDFDLFPGKKDDAQRFFMKNSPSWKQSNRLFIGNGWFQALQLEMLSGCQRASYQLEMN